jgi:hypothetical protein
MLSTRLVCIVAGTQSIGGHPGFQTTISKAAAKKNLGMGQRQPKFILHRAQIKLAC